MITSREELAGLLQDDRVADVLKEVAHGNVTVHQLADAILAARRQVPGDEYTRLAIRAPWWRRKGELVQAVQLTLEGRERLQEWLRANGVNAHWYADGQTLHFGSKRGSYSTPVGWWVLLYPDGAEHMADPVFRERFAPAGADGHRTGLLVLGEDECAKIVSEDLTGLLRDLILKGRSAGVTVELTPKDRPDWASCEGGDRL